MKKFLAAVLSLMIIGMAGVALAAEDEESYPNPVRDMMATYGKVQSAEGSQLTVSGEGNIPYIIAVLTSRTYLLDGKTGQPLTPGVLAKDAVVTVYYSSTMQSHNPDKSEAYAVVAGSASDDNGKFLRVEQVAPSDEADAVKVLNSNRDIVATITPDACQAYDKIKPGDNLLVWYSFMSFGIPAKTEVNRAVILNPRS